MSIPSLNNVASTAAHGAASLTNAYGVGLVLGSVVEVARNALNQGLKYVGFDGKVPSFVNVGAELKNADIKAQAEKGLRLFVAAFVLRQVANYFFSGGSALVGDVLRLGGLKEVASSLVAQVQPFVPFKLV